MSNDRRILLVDDVAMFRELGALFLARTGPVDLAENAGQALEIVNRRAPQVVIADMHLPDKTGPELCRLLKSVSPEEAPRVILLARPDSSADHAAAVRAGADEVLFKPLERDGLIASVRRLTDFGGPRGLPRARMEQPVQIFRGGEPIAAIAHNISRGGLFVDAESHFNESEEVSVAFSLDGNGTVVTPTAQVVWSCETDEGRDRIGLRFLEIDARTVDKLEHYVTDHFPRVESVPS